MAQQQRSPAGYRSLAAAMGESPQWAIFKRFGTLNAQNLLYLQAELTSLEKKLVQYVKEDQAATGDDRDKYDRDWETLKASCDTDPPAPGNDNRQWTTFLEIRAKLKEYSTYDKKSGEENDLTDPDDALLQQNELLKLESPNASDIRMLQQWMNSTTRGCISLLGPDSEILQKEDPDHVTLRLSQAKDPLFRSLSKDAIQWYHLHIGHHFRVGNHLSE